MALQLTKLHEISEREFVELEEIREDMNFEVLTEGWGQRQVWGGTAEGSQGNLWHRETAGKGPGYVSLSLGQEEAEGWKLSGEQEHGDRRVALAAAPKGQRAFTEEARGNAVVQRSCKGGRNEWAERM